ncbi:CGNR zinc finger domain-containing protein [Micromonospora sp. NPDC049559]|uniref:CGNR zinc finger domain-containing protein n=1 Tax=Micromonospora sp. NPDC049559 TaxID=3155923 RepID=UPI003434F08D
MRVHPEPAGREQEVRGVDGRGLDRDERTQRWDSYETCGNRVNVAAFRARKKQPRTVD